MFEERGVIILNTGRSFIKFIQGSYTDFKLLDAKENNVIYVITDENPKNSGIYLGDIQIANLSQSSDGSNTTDYFKYLSDVLLFNLQDKDLLFYNESSSCWENISFDNLVSEINNVLPKDKLVFNNQIFYFTENGTVDLIGFNEAPNGAILTKDESGHIVWNVPDTSQLDSLDSAVQDLTDEATQLSGRINQMEILIDKKVNADNVYTKEETNLQINTAISNLDHLTRIIVPDILSIDLSAEDVDKYIYMIPSITPSGNNLYDEYMFVDGALERVGVWDTDLSGFATTEDLEKKVDKKNGYGLVEDSEIDKLLTVEENAQKNIINAVSEEFEIVDVARILNLKSVPAVKILDLNTHPNIISINSNITSMDSRMTEIEKRLNNTYVTKEEFNLEVLSLKNSVTWTDI